MSRPRCKHGNTICSRCVVVTDAAKRIAEGIRLAVLFHEWDEIKNGWMAFALQDGQTNHTVYPSKAVAVTHMSNEFHYMYVNLRACIAGMPEKDAQLMLEYHREAYDAGMRTTEPEAPQLIFPLARNSGPWPK